MRLTSPLKSAKTDDTQISAEQTGVLRSVDVQKAFGEDDPAKHTLQTTAMNCKAPSISLKHIDTGLAAKGPTS